MSHQYYIVEIVGLYTNRKRTKIYSSLEKAKKAIPFAKAVYDEGELWTFHLRPLPFYQEPFPKDRWAGY